MSDYINREDAIKAFEPKQRRDWYTPWIVETLEDLPSADVVPMERYKSMENTCVKLQKSLADVAPVRHGKWVFVGDNMFECLRCGVVYTLQQLDGLRNYDTDHCMPNYCPNCGAKMDDPSTGK